MKKYIKPTVDVNLFQCDVIAASGWQQEDILDNEGIFQDIYFK